MWCVCGVGVCECGGIVCVWCVLGVVCLCGLCLWFGCVCGVCVWGWCVCVIVRV